MEKFIEKISPHPKITELITLNEEVLQTISKIKNMRSFNKKIKLEFSNLCLNYEIVKENLEFEKIKFNDYFINVHNFFKDDLPTNEYFDVKDVLNKYLLIDKSIIESVLESWDNCLNTILKELKAKINLIDEYYFSIEKIISNFGIDFKENIYCYNFKPISEKISNFTFSYVIEGNQTSNDENLTNLQNLLKNNFVQTKDNYQILSFVKNNNEPINVYPTSIQANGDPYKYRGYILKLTKHIKVNSLSVLITLVGVLNVYLIDETGKIIHHSKKTCNSSLPNWEEVEFGNVTVKNLYSILINYDGTGNLSYQEGNNLFRFINDICEAESKSAILKEDGKFSLVDNTYSPQIIMKFL